MIKQEIERREVKEVKSVPKIRKDGHTEHLLRKQNYKFDIDRLVNESKNKIERINCKKAEDLASECEVNKH